VYVGYGADDTIDGLKDNDFEFKLYDISFEAKCDINEFLDCS